MISFIRYKIKNKRWLNSCLLIGVALLSGFLCVYPMFLEGSLNRMLQSLFVQNAEETNEFPAVMTKDTKYYNNDVVDVDGILNRLDEEEGYYTRAMGLPVLERQRVFWCFGSNANVTFSGKSRQVNVAYLDNMYDYAVLVHGVRAEDAESSDNELVKQAISEGQIPCVISEITMDKYSLSVGETLSFKFRMYDNEASEYKFVITGIIKEDEQKGVFWNRRLTRYEKDLFLTKEGYSRIMAGCNGEEDHTIVEDCVMLDYTYIKSENVDNIKRALAALTKAEVDTNMQDIISTYNVKERSISIIMFTFELPIIALLLLFLYMISSQILEMETTEIAMLKSRGVSRIKVIGVYILQSAVIAFAGSIIGVPLGYGMCKLGAGTNAFLSFTLKDVSVYRITYMMVPFALIAFGLAILFMSIPVIGLSKLTIIARKSEKYGTKVKAVWEKFYLDILLLGISGYLLYNYNKQKDVMSTIIMSGGSIDPIVFLDSSLFILAAGLVFLRLLHYLERFIYFIGKKRWKPASYVAFLQITRGAKKQGFISVFLIMTVAMGIFNANLARTIDENMSIRTTYSTGSNVVIKEKWLIKTFRSDAGTNWSYPEPDYERFNIIDDMGVVSKTKVITDDKVKVSVGSNRGPTENECTMMAINTKEFGETVDLKSGLNSTHWYNYLNALSQKTNGVLVSRNFAVKYKVSEGDTLVYTRFSPIDPNKEEISENLYIVGIFDAFPGYDTYEYVRKSDGTTETKENYLIVMNYATAINDMGQTPYSIWMRVTDDADTVAMKQKLVDSGMILRGFDSAKDIIQAERDSDIFQITNGMFSIGFIISLLICGVGFLIYWILTIRGRTLIYGIYRAMGMSMKEIVKMLVIEQIFGSLCAVLTGFGVGTLTTYLFTKLIAIVYLPEKHNIGLEVFVRASDITKMLIIVAVVFVICFAVIRKIVKDMNIAKALKMGAD